MKTSLRKNEQLITHQAFNTWTTSTPSETKWNHNTLKKINVCCAASSDVIWKDQWLYRKSTVNILINSEQRLKKLIRKVGHKMLYMIRMKLYKDTPAVQEGSNCTCEAKTTFSLPCCHNLSQMDKDYLKIQAIHLRWWITDENVNHVQEEVYVSASNPWMKYAVVLEAAFRRCKGT